MSEIAFDILSSPGSGWQSDGTEPDIGLAPVRTAERSIIQCFAVTSDLPLYLEDEWRGIQQGLLQDLEQLRQMAGRRDWTGEAAEPLAGQTVGWAETLIKILPANVDAPDIDATPQGEVDFAREGPDGEAFDVLVLPSGHLAISGIFGGVHFYGNVEWDQRRLPDFVASGLRWVHGRE